MKNLDIILMDLSKIKNVEEAQLIINELGLDNVSAKKVMEFKSQSSKLYIEKNSQKIVFYLPIGGSKVMSTADFTSLLSQLQSADEIIKNMDVSVNSMSVDEILEKINQSGIGSLTKKEKERLDFLSKS